MSLSLIHQYYNEKQKIRNISKQDSESVLRRAFARLLEGFLHKKHLTLIEEFTYRTPLNTNIRFDGIVKNDMGLTFGFWEAKAKVDLEDEIRKKFNKGYPNSNIIFEDGNFAVLYQEGVRAQKVAIHDAKALNELLENFIHYETPDLKSFREAVTNFKKDVPEIAATLRTMIDEQNAQNPKFQKTRNRFLDICKESINPDVKKEDVDEMLIQHILTEQIFMSVFSDNQFIRENNIARELYKVEETFFTGSVKRTTLDQIKNYYDIIAHAAKSLNDHNEKQFFLKKVYENFYKAYNPKGADKLGIVYTPSEIVQFQIKATEYLLEKHFGKTLSDRGVDILDPATGTGTYITDLIEHINPHDLPYKYKHEIHANEVAILPYYIANLNIEYTYRNKIGTYAEFPNICFVDTLDNIGGLGWEAKQFDMFGFSAENAERIKKQNERKISVIIGNPPYNAKQENFNDDNKNRVYKQVDKRIKDTYIKEGTAQNQIVLYDMYVRFFRWASDRLAKNGVLSFVSNSSFIDSLSFDGFRKTAAKEFNEIYIINLKGNARTSGERRRQEGGNVFSDDIRVGIAVYFFVKKEGLEGCRVFYNAIEDYAEADRKKAYLRENTFKTIDFQKTLPDAKGNWINQTDNDFEELMPIISKELKAGKEANAIFKLFSRGVETTRDEWVFDLSKQNLFNKMNFFVKIYNESIEKNELNYEIKWSSSLESFFQAKKKALTNESLIINAEYRPYNKKLLYSEPKFNHRLTSNHFDIFGRNLDEENVQISISGIGSSKNFQTLCTKALVSLDFLEKTQCLPLYTYDKQGTRHSNITDWALQEFQSHYSDTAIDKTAIFYYVYAVLHAPKYRAAYEQNLKRDFPRIPKYSDFWQYAKRGEALADLHIGYETVAPYPLEVVTVAPPRKGKPKAEGLFEEKSASEAIFVPKPKLKANKVTGEIEIDELTTLRGIPTEAWEYKLGNRSALEWILDQYKESKPSDTTIAEHFNTYRFADYKEVVLDLLCRVCRVSVETVRLVGEL